MECAVRVEGVESERERHVVVHILQTGACLALNRDLADVTAFLDVGDIQHGKLPRLPGQDQITGLDALFGLQPVEGPGLIAHRNHIGHRRNAFRQRNTGEQRRVRRVVAVVGIHAVVARKARRTLENIGIGERRREETERLNPAGNDGELGPSEPADDPFARELLPPALGLAVINHQIGKRRFPVVPKSRT